MSDQADVELRIDTVADGLDRRLDELSIGSSHALTDLKAQLSDGLSSTGAALADETARSEAAVWALTNLINDESRATAATISEHRAALNALDESLTNAVANLAGQVDAVRGEQREATDVLRRAIAASDDRQEVALQAVRGDVEAIDAAQSAALQHAASRLAGRLNELAEAQSTAAIASAAALEAHVAAAEADRATDHEAHAQLVQTVDAQNVSVTERLSAFDAALERASSRLSSISKRVDAALAASGRMDELADLIDQLRDRLTVAETQLQQRDLTEIELQLDRMESFERLAAETNPDLFAAKEELDELRERLAEIERDVRAVAEA